MMEAAGIFAALLVLLIPLALVAFLLKRLGSSLSGVAKAVAGIGSRDVSADEVVEAVAGRDATADPAYPALYRWGALIGALGKLILWVVVAGAWSLPFVAGYQAYQTISTHDKVSDGLALASGLTEKIHDYLNQHGTWPANDGQMDLFEGKISSPHVQSVDVSNGVIIITFRESPISGSTLELHPSTIGRKIIWNCTHGGTLESRWRPSQCR